MNSERIAQKEKKKTGSFSKYAVSILFLVFVFGVTLLNALWPDRTFSDKENRVLASFPKFSLYNLFLNKDKWTLNFETYMTDQFPMRDQWVGLKAVCEKLELKTENKGVYFAAGDSLIEHPDAPNFKTIDANIASVNKFAAKAGVPMYFALAPNSIYIYTYKLPAYAYDGEQGAVIARAAQKLSKDVTNIDIASPLTAHKSEYIYYRTDHHWTSLGAYYGYEALAEPMGYQALPMGAFERTVVSKEFAGTMLSRSGAWWVQPDSVELFRAKQEPVCEIYENNALQTSQSDPYFMDRLKTVDKYTVFLDGNHPLTVLKSNNGGKKLLLIKDSFSHCLAPFLAQNFGEIHLIDLRYYKNSIADYIKKAGIDEVLVLYSVENFSTDKNVLFLNS